MIGRRLREAFRKRRGLRSVAILSWVAILIGGGIATLEFAARKLLPVWHSEIGYRHMQPYFMTGGYNDEFVQGVKNFGAEPGPWAYGYSYDDGIYAFSFEKEVHSISERGNFLFQDRVALANEAKTDQVLRVFAIGGSTAYGIGASTIDKRWYAVLEETLSKDLGRSVQIIPAAMPGYVSTQERLILEFMVLPRSPDAIIIFDAWNDAVLPALFGSRPGDPYDQGILYLDFYAPLFGLQKWFAKRSHLYLFLFHRSVGKALDKRRDAITNEENILARYSRSTAAVYVDNVGHMLERCRDKDIPCNVFVQPALDLTLYNNPAEAGGRQVDKLTVAAYGEILRAIDEMNSEGAIHDLTGVFDGAGREKWYLDPVHFNDAGHAAIAEAMFPIVREALLKRLEQAN